MIYGMNSVHTHHVQHTLSYTPQHRPFQHWSLFIVIGTFWALILFVVEDFWDALYMPRKCQYSSLFSFTVK